MARVLKRFAFVLLFCTLAVQGYSAVAMPFCAHQPIQHHATLSDHDHHAPVNTACDDCAFCQLCAAPALPATHNEAISQSAPALNPQSPAHFFVFVPEQTQHPPLS
jgi:hypothetical protein